MAIANADGSIVLTTAVDTTGLNKGLGTVKGATAKLGQAFSKLGGYIATSLGVAAFVRFSKAAGEMATEQEASVQRLIDIYGSASKAIGDYIDANARALGMSQSAAVQFSSVYGNLFSVWADQKTNAELTAHYLNMTAVVASKTGRTIEDVQERVRSGLLGNTEAIEDLGVFVNVKTIEMTDAFKRMADGKSWEQLGAYQQQQIRTMAILEQATQKYGDTVSNTTALTRAQYRAAYQDMQATWGQFVNVVLMPVLQVVTQIMNIITAGLRAIAGITGKTIENTEGISSSIGGAVDNQNNLTDAVKGTNKELKKTLAGFDDIQILSSNATSGGDGAGAAGGVADMNLGMPEGADGDLTGQISEVLTTVMGVAGGFLAAIGVLLLINGHIGWGLGFIIAGAAALGVSIAAIGGSDFGIETKFSSIMTIIAGFVLALGIILLIKVPSAQPLALGMIIAGAGVLGVGMAQVAANKIGGDIEQTMHGIITILSGFLLAIGIILLCFGQVTPLSIGLVVTGAVGLATEIALYPDEVAAALQGWVGGILAIISGALLVVGIVLCVCGIVTPLSIGMIVAGAAGLATELALNWNYVLDKVSTFFTDNAGLIVGVSLALVVIGIILLFTGVGIPLAIGLIVAGGAALATTAAVNWDFIVDKIKEVWDKVKNFWNTYIAPIFTAEWWTDLGKTVMNGLISGFEAGINGVIGMFETMINWIVNGLNKISFTIPDWVPGIGSKNFGFNIPNVSFDRVSIPRLARGAVIPPNREFLAVLGDQKHGTNIEAPLETIVDAMNVSLRQNLGFAGEIQREIVLNIDGKEFARTLIDLNRRGSRIVGTRLVQI